MSEPDLQALREAWQKRFRKEQEEAALRRQTALDAAKRAADFLHLKYSAKKVFLYGSLAWSKLFTEHSDIDLLIDGYQRALLAYDCGN